MVVEKVVVAAKKAKTPEKIKKKNNYFYNFEKMDLLPATCYLF